MDATELASLIAAPYTDLSQLIQQVTHLLDTSLVSSLAPPTLKHLSTSLAYALKHSIRALTPDDTLTDTLIDLIAALSTVGGRDTSLHKCMQFPNHTLRIKEQSFLTASFGYQIWNSAHVFVQYYIVVSVDFRLVDEGKVDLDGEVVLELGCGTGLAGIYSAMQTKLTHIYLTDYMPEIVQNTLTNIVLNEVEARATPFILDWASPTTPLPLPHQSTDQALPDISNFPRSFTRIIATDICYDIPSAILATQTLAFYLVPTGLAYVVLPIRHTFEAELHAFESSMAQLPFTLISADTVPFTPPSSTDTSQFKFYIYRKI